MNQEKLIENRDRLIETENRLFDHCKTTAGTYLNLGCGPRILEGFRNIDRYDEKADVQDDIMLLATIDSDTVDVMFSAHSLQHLPIRYVPRALGRWSEVMKRGGELLLSMPDLDLICQALLSNGEATARQWLKYTLFGYQAPPGSDDSCLQMDEGQFNYSGYAMAEIISLLRGVGIVCDNHYQYDGYSTPSFFVHGIKE